jgi:hypothetical protein
MPSFASRTCGSPDKKVAKGGKETGDDADDLGSEADAAAGSGNIVKKSVCFDVARTHLTRLH